MAGGRGVGIIGIAVLGGMLGLPGAAWAGPARAYEGQDAVAAPASGEPGGGNPSEGTAAPVGQPPGDKGEALPSTEADSSTAAPQLPGTTPADKADEGFVAAPMPPRHSIVYRNLFGLRYNPLGLTNEFLIGYRLQLSSKEGPLWRDTFFAVKFHNYLNPAFVRTGPMVEIQPIALLNLSATYNYTAYFKTFDQFMSFPTPTAEYSDTRLSELGDAGQNYVTWGHRVRLAALLQAKVWNIAVRDYVQFHYNKFDMNPGDTVYYNQELDILEPGDGWSVVNDLDLIYLFDFGLKLGARYTVTHAFYKQNDFLPGEPISQPNGPTHRVGPAILHTFYDKPDRRFNKPTLVFLAQWWARHRYRTGADVHAAVPYLVLAFLFEGQLWPDPRKGKKRKR